jgi:Protein of unknown function (DUF1566)
MTQETESAVGDRHRRSVHRVRFALVGAALLLAAGPLFTATGATAAMTPETCLASKRKAWGNLRKCQAAQEIRQLKGQSSDLAKCQATFEAKLAQITEKATEAEIACRYRDGDDGTVTDYDTGLQWEKKNGAPGLGGLCILGDVHCVQNQYDWNGANAFVDASADAVALTTCYFDRCDWRLPTSAELLAIVDTSVVGCEETTPCIDPVFGSTNLGPYWTATTLANNPTFVWQVHFGQGDPIADTPDTDAFVRAVRAAF